MGSRDARAGPGRVRYGRWVAVQLLRDVDEPRRRAIIGTWQSREHWARWHDDGTFKVTCAELAGLEDGPSSTVWYDVVEERA